MAVALGADVRSRLIGRNGHGETDIPSGLSRRDELAVRVAGHLGALMLQEGEFSRPDPSLDAYGPDEIADALTVAGALLARERRALYVLAVAIAQRGRVSGPEARAVVRASGARLS